VKARNEQVHWIKWAAYSGAALARVKRFPAWSTFSGERLKAGINEASLGAFLEGVKNRQRTKH
jgi:hypothetical protein